MFGLPHVLPPAWMQAHDQQVAAHYHITIQGVDVPANIGIDANLWHDHSLDSYGIQGYAPIHTHDTSGTVHIESAKERSYSLADFFNTWGYHSSSVCLVTVGASCTPISDIHSVILHDGDVFRVGD